MVQATCENLILSFVNPHIHQSGILVAPIAKTYPELKYLWGVPWRLPQSHYYFFLDTSVLQWDSLVELNPTTNSPWFMRLAFIKCKCYHTSNHLQNNIECPSHGQHVLCALTLPSSLMFHSLAAWSNGFHSVPRNSTVGYSRALLPFWKFLLVLFSLPPLSLLNVHVHVDVHTYVWMLSACVWDHRSTISIFFYGSLPYFMRQSLTEPGAHLFIQPGCPTGSKDPPVCTIPYPWD